MDVVDVSTEWILNISVILNATARDSTAPLHPMPYDAQILVIVTRNHSHCNLLFAVSRDITVHVIRAAEHSKFGF